MGSNNNNYNKINDSDILKKLNLKKDYFLATFASTKI